MGREIRGVPDPAPLTGGTGPLAEGEARGCAFSIGAYLARERRLRRISIGELAELTKIPPRSIERMEAGAFDGNPDGFVRGFVRAIALALGLDPEEAVMRMLGEPADLAEAGEAPALRLDRRHLAIFGLLVATVGLGLAIWGWASRAPSADDMPKIVYRRDAVRALADEQARSPGAAQSAVGGSEPVGSPGDQHPY
ncbi:MAG: helix-turn-helix domain-containing protein [Myxococcales bacterium]|nr:helix-turn-helix domain-containing protein [Myxococcales bacterium]